jgi:hypothetical protein
VDTQPFPINTINIACKKILVRPEMAEKARAKTSSLAIFVCQIYHKRRLLKRLRTIRLKSPEAPRGRHN